jgi:DNA-binding MarR family transcriptional regulator
MYSDLYELSKTIGILREAVGKKDIPAIWLEFFLRVADAGEKGIRTQELIHDLDMTQGIASRTVKLLSRYYNTVTEQSEGYDLLVTAPDFYYRKQQRVFLSDRGKIIAGEIIEQLGASKGK